MLNKKFHVDSTKEVPVEISTAIDAAARSFKAGKMMDLIKGVLMFEEYSLKEFFDKIEENELEDITMEELMSYDFIAKDPFNVNMIKEAQEKIFPYAAKIANDASIIDIRKAAEMNQDPMKIFKLAAGKKNQGKKEPVTDPDVVVNNILGNPNPAIVRPGEAVTPIASAEMKMDADTERALETINSTVVKYLPHGTEVTTQYSYGYFYTVNITFTDGTTNTVTVDGKNVLPDYFSALTHDADGNNILVPIGDKICSNIFNTPMYQLTGAETYQVKKNYYLDNMKLYFAFDMSTLKGFNRLEVKNRRKLNSILTEIMEAYENSGDGLIPRFRFESFDWVDDFVVVSDPMTKSPFSYAALNSTLINGDRVVVKKGKITLPKGIAEEAEA